jgi:hypothetical protein
MSGDASMSMGVGSGRAYVPSQLLPRAGVVVAALLLASCGGGDGDGPSVTPTRTPNLPSATAEPTSAEPSTEESPAGSPTRTRTPRATATVTTTQREENPSPSETTSEDGSETAEDSSDNSADAPTWAWLLAALAILVALVAIIILVRRRRRAGAWATDFTTAGEEVAWFAQVMLPQLLAADSIQQVAGGWVVGESRVAAAEDRLTTLEATAPDDIARMRARALRDAVRAARQDVQRLVAPGAGVVPTADLMAIGVRLEEARTAATLRTA